VNILQAIEDKNLFRPFLADGKDSLTTWSAWETALRCLYGLPIRKQAHDLVRACTGRDPNKLPKAGFDTALFLTGRRSGKTRMASIIAAYEAVLSGREARLAKGERGMVPVVSPTKAQSGVVRDYMRAIFDTPILAGEVVSETREGFELKSGTRIEVLAGDWRTVRNYTGLAAIVEEACFLGFAEESKVRTDTELIRALKPSLATCGGRMIVISSPYAMKGWCFQQWKRHFGRDDSRVLVWNCPSRTMNPTLPQSVVDEALEEDPQAAASEYLGQFRDDLATFLPRDIIESLVVKGRIELPPQPGIHHAAFVDLSGGRVDDAALAIAHKVGPDRIVLDFIRRWRPPFNPDAVIADMVGDLQRYNIKQVLGDNYAAEFVRSNFKSRGVRFERVSTNPWAQTITAKVAKNRSQLYLEMLPRLLASQVELLDNPTLINQLAGLVRKTRSGGRDIVDHAPGQHDDLANVVAGVCDSVMQRQPARLGVLFATDSSDDGMASVRRLAERARRDAEADYRDLRKGDELAEGMWMPSGSGIFSHKAPVSRDAPRPNPLGIPVPFDNQ